MPKHRHLSQLFFLIIELIFFFHFFVWDIFQLSAWRWRLFLYSNLTGRVEKRHHQQGLAGDAFEVMPLNGPQELAINEVDRRVKRLFDVVASVFLLLGLIPFMMVIALLIKISSPGPIFFRQQRVGEGGRLFWMYKFRSMVEGAEKQEADLLQKTSAGWPSFVKTPEDPRVTQIGRFLRRTSLDELPQLFNVLKGEMSLVGPRPELPNLVDMYQSWQYKRFAVPQGMTGWWQVNGRMKRADPWQRLEDDLFYIKNYSLWLDLLILWKTIKAIIDGEGAY